MSSHQGRRRTSWCGWLNQAQVIGGEMLGSVSYTTDRRAGRDAQAAGIRGTIRRGDGQ